VEEEAEGTAEAVDASSGGGAPLMPEAVELGGVPFRERKRRGGGGGASSAALGGRGKGRGRGRRGSSTGRPLMAASGGSVERPFGPGRRRGRAWECAAH
jgi:hypothetical protein